MRGVADDLLLVVVVMCKQGFDEFMNVVLDDAEEVWVKDTKTKKLGARNPLGTLSLLYVSPDSLTGREKIR